ncbi:MAG TPA: protein kinase [Candidatus Polarisedimenticolia bacterium]|nr:protein kinase [Candidatus Polarisedimenticolia bacterium]
MTLPAGSRLGPYEILGPLGAGGMGEVYRARDTRLGRDVAIKILPESLAADPDALARFEREARAVAALSHPNILAIHDFGVEAGRAYTVTELLEGRTLRERLASGPMPLRKATECAAQIARGLAAAHDRGVVHRDLKPENLFVTDDGQVKILDFGLAKVGAPGEIGGDASLTRTPTRQLETRPGVVLGTIGYMSPEQVRGLQVDHRTDVFSFGAVLYEMLSGRRAFQGATAADTMTAILREEPAPLSGVDRALPPALERLVHHCLEKNPAERFQSARDLAFHLEATSGASASISSGISDAAIARPDAAQAHSPRVGRGPLIAAAAAALAAGMAAGVVLGLRSRPPAAPPPSLRQLTYTGADSDPAASDDGRLIAYTSTREGRERIWLKQSLGGDEVALTAGPDSWPSFSPDGTQVLFIHHDGGRTDLYRVPVVGGEPRKILEDVLMADWSPDGRAIAYVRRLQEGEKLISSVGLAGPNGDGAKEIARDENQSLLFPRWSPDGSTIALIRRGAENSPEVILLLKPEGGGSQVLETPAPAGNLTPVVWSSDSRAVVYGKEEGFVSAGALGGTGRILRQDIASGRAEVIMWSPMRPMDLAILGSGRLILSSSTQRQNLLVAPAASDRRAGGHRWITRGNAVDRQPVFSPDGEWVLFSSNRSGNLELWKVSTSTGAIRRLTDDPAQDWDPAFTPDGAGILWSSSRDGHFEIWIGNVDGTGARRVTNDGVDAENPTMTRDGWIVYNSSNPATSGIWKIRADGTQATRVVQGFWSTPEVSPDGQWVAFRTRTIPRMLHIARLSDGRMEPTAIGGVIGFTTNARPRWSSDGRMILWNDSNNLGEGGVYAQAFVPGTDTTRTRRLLAVLDGGQRIDSYAISPDGAHVVLAVVDTLDSLLLAEGVPGIEPPRPAGRP